MLPSAATESPGKTRYESQSLLSLQTEKYDRTGSTHRATQIGTLIKPGLLKSGNLMN